MNYEGHDKFMNKENKISKLVQQTLDIINNGKKDYKELIAMYNNSQKHEKITDYEREILSDTLVSILRTKYPKQSSRILGNKSIAAQELLEEMLVKVKEEFNWESNKHDKHVKAGGSMISGKKFVCWYISYKNSQGWSCGFGYIQVTPNDLPYLEINKREISKNSIYEPMSKKYNIHSKQDALDNFKLFLIDMIE